MKKRSKVHLYKTILGLSSQYSVSLLCSVALVSRSGYYKWLKRQSLVTSKQKRDNQVKQLILECYHKVNGIYGYPRIKGWLLKTYGVVVNHKRVYRLMKELGIQAKIRRKRRWFGKRSNNIVAPNLLNRDFCAIQPNRKLVTDITYLIFNSRRLYLSVIYDLFNNEVLSYKISEQNGLSFVLDTVKFLTKKRDVIGAVLHSDQGFHYTSNQYNKLLQEYNIIPSMSRKGNCLDNAKMEEFFSHLKSEVMYINNFKTKSEVIEAIDKYIVFYNSERIQAKLNNLSPVEYRAQVCA